ncbi:MAG: hypothetical protein NT166_27230 [Candidatus Aminicenantes bacterium]|nr:hypothetical protein [Candidatus Aminicenantes bacterium]
MPGKATGKAKAFTQIVFFFFLLLFSSVFSALPIFFASSLPVLPSSFIIYHSIFSSALPRFLASALPFSLVLNMKLSEPEFFIIDSD